MSRRTMFLIGLVCSVLLYEAPYVLTLLKTGWQSLPPVLVADQMLYLNVSAIRHVSPTEVINPWYGIRVLSVDVPHLMFPITFQLFAILHRILSSWTAAVLIWTAIWTALIFAAGVVCLESFFPNTDRSLSTMGAFGLIALQSPLIYVAEMRLLPSPHGFLELQLPYLRFAIPQVILPVVLLYWGLQVRALKRGSTLALAAMTALQFAEFAAFPYILPVLALGTGIAILIAKYRQNEIALSWKAIAAYAAACAALDLGYLLLAGFGKSHANVHFALRFRPELIPHEVRAYVLLLVLGSILALFSRASLATSATAAGLGLSNAVFGFADVFIAPQAQMLEHPHYIVGITTWLPLFVFFWSYLERLDRRWSRGALILVLLLTGSWQAFSSYRLMLKQNLFQAATIKQLDSLSLTANDLVIAPSRFSDDISSWIPLISPAKVLYTPDGENILSEDQTRADQVFRQALYLRMTGMNVPSLYATTAATSRDALLSPLLQQGDRTYAGSHLATDRAEVRLAIRKRLESPLRQVDEDLSSALTIFAAYRRIIVVDSTTTPVFEESVFAKWLTLADAFDAQGVKIYICTPRPEHGN